MHNVYLINVIQLLFELIFGINKVYMKKIILIILLAFFMSGCAAAPKKSIAYLPGSSTYINGIGYTPVSDVMRSYNAGHEWDPVARKLVLTKKGKKAVFCIGAKIALLDNSIHDMPGFTAMDAGKVMIPTSFARTILKDFFVPAVPYTKKPEIPYSGQYAIKTIVVDPGHGGKDPGAISRSGVKEKYVNLVIAKQLKKYLEASGIKVILTRDRDKFVSLWARSDMANKQNADFFISIHANSARSSQANGIEVFYLSDAVDDFARATAALENAAIKYEDSSFNANGSKTSAETTLMSMLYAEYRAESKELAGSILKGMTKTLGAKNRGTKGAKFYVLKGVRIPSVLIEVGFLSNAGEARKLNSSSYQTKVARAIANGVLLFKRRYEQTDGFTR